MKCKEAVKDDASQKSDGLSDDIKAFNKLFLDALKVRKEFLSVTVAALNIAEQVASATQWDWAKNAQNQGVLQMHMTSMKTSVNEFGRMWLAEEPSHIKKSVNHDKLSVELKTFLDAKPAVEKVSKFIGVLIKQHKARGDA